MRRQLGWLVVMVSVGACTAVRRVPSADLQPTMQIRLHSDNAVELHHRQHDNDTLLTCRATTVRATVRRVRTDTLDLTDVRLLGQRAGHCELVNGAYVVLTEGATMRIEREYTNYAVPMILISLFLVWLSQGSLGWGGPIITG